MRKKTKAIGLLLSFLTAALWFSSDVIGQGSNVGDARGEVKLCSIENGKRQERPETGVTICAIREDNWNKNFKCPNNCRRPECRRYTTKDKDNGRFRFSALNVGSWVFVAVKKEFKLRGLFAKSAIMGNDKPIVVEPIEPPPPLWLQPTNCPDLASNKSGSGSASREQVVSSARKGQKSYGIKLVLYQSERPERSPAQTGITLRAKVVDVEFQPLVNAEVFISVFTEDGAADLSMFPKPTKTDSDGFFSFALPEQWKLDTYVFSVTRDGYRPSIMTLEQAIKKLNSTQGAENYIILVRKEEFATGSGSLLETIESTRRHVLLPEVMQTLPLPGTRSFDQFALLAPGVMPPPETFGGVGPGVSSGVGTAGQFSVNGLRSRENNFTIDGSDNNDEDIGTRRQGFIMTVPQPVESVHELQVITALGDARFGRNIGGQINALTKTGGNGSFHGTLYGYITDNHFNARDPFDQSVSDAAASFTPRRLSDGAPVFMDGAPLVNQSQVGGENQFTRLQLGLAAGGQITQHTSYFVSTERQDVRADQEAHFAVPTVRQRGVFESGDTGLLLPSAPGGPAPLYPASVPGNAIISLFPFPNNPLGPYGDNTYSTVLPADGHGIRFSVKLGREFPGEAPDMPWWKTVLSLKPHIEQITGRYNFTDELSTLPVTGGALFSSLRPKVRTQNLSGFINRSFSSTTSDTIRISFGRTKLSFGERRAASMLESSALPGTLFLLNAPLLLNVTRPNPDGTLNSPTFFSAAGPAGSALLNSLGYQGVTQTEQITGPLGQVFVAGFSPIGVDVENFPQTRANNTFQIADTVTWIHESHILNLGVDVRKTRINSTLDRNFRPRVTFNGLSSGPFADIVERPGSGPVQASTLTGMTLAAAGVPTGLFQTLATVPTSSIGVRYTQVNLFFQDQWRVHQRLYLTGGVRYELNTVPKTLERRLETAFDPEDLRTLAEQASQFCQPNVRCSDLVSALTTAFPANFKGSFSGDRNDFDVRLGFAWTPAKLRDTVIRGGFGTYSGQFPGIVIDQARNAFPNFLPLNLANFTPRSGDRTYLFNLASPAVQQLLPSPGGVPAGITPGTLNELRTVNPVAFLVNQIFNLQNVSLAPTAFGLDLILPQRELKPPYSLQYALTLERQFRNDYMISVAYVGTRGLSLLRLSTPDLGINDSRFAGPIVVGPLTADEPFPYLQGQIRPAQARLISQSFAIARTFFESSSQSTYHSMQIEFRKRYSDAFLVGSAFTYSQSFDDASDFFDNAGAFALPQNSAFRSERGASNFDVRVRSATHFVVDLQRRWFGKKALARVLGGFQLAGIFTAQGGQPYTVNSALDINRDGNLTDRLNTLLGIIRDPAGGRVQLRLAPGLNTRDLLAPDGLDGSVGRNTFRAPTLYNIDLSVTHTIPLRDHHRFVIRLELLNLLNRPNYGIPNRILESPSFGTSISTLTPPRTIQFVGKFQF